LWIEMNEFCWNNWINNEKTVKKSYSVFKLLSYSGSILNLACKPKYSTRCITLFVLWNYNEDFQIGKYLYDAFSNGQTIICHEDLKIGDDFRKNFGILFTSLFDESDQELSDILRSIFLEADYLVQKVVQQVWVLL